MKLREILDIEEIKILKEEKTKDGETIEIRVPFVELDKKNSNGRTYSQKLMQREVKKVQSKVESGGFLGMSDHPESGLGSVEGTSHLIKKLELDEAGLGWATLKIIPTQKGKTVQTIIRENGRLGLSMRGFGDVASDGRVLDNYSFQGLDIVLNPSVKSAMFDKSNIVESMDFQEKKSAPSEELIKFVLDGAFAQRKEIGHTETYEEFLKEHGAAIKASILVEYGIYDSIEEALIKMGEEGVLRKMKSEEKTHVYTPDECYIEARLMNISPDEMAKRLNFAEERKKIDRGSDFSLHETQSLIEEAQSAGTDLSDPKVRKEFLEKMKEMPTHEEPTLHERSLQIQESLKAKGTESSIESIKRILIHDDKLEEKKRKKQLFEDRWKRDIEQSGSRMSNKEVREFINEQLKKAGFGIKEED